MEYVERDGVRLCVERLGSPDDPALLLISGQGSQLTNWPLGLCEAWVDRGFQVIRFDNRDTGRSTILDNCPSYTLSDMAGDAVAIIRAFGFGPAHVVGISMGGMIGQVLAAEHPDDVASLVSYASATGNPDYGWPDDVVWDALMLSATTREEVIDNAVAGKRIWGTPGTWDESEFRDFIGANFDRGHSAEGANRHLEAIAASGDRDAQVRSIRVPTLVIHGSDDPLVTPSGGRHTAELIDGADYVELEGVGHDIPPTEWSHVVELVTSHAAGAAEVLRR